jgi:hypothetical protein
MMPRASKPKPPAAADVGDDLVYEPRIHPGLREQAVPVESLNEFYKNYNTGDDEVVAKSLRRNGQYKAITVNKGTLTGRPDEILCGNTTYRAARDLLEWPDIAVEFVDVGEYAARRIVAADNESAKKAKIDKDALHDLLAPLAGDLEGTAVTDEEFGKLVGPSGNAPDESGLAGEQKYAVIIECRDEAQQLELLETFEAEGLEARALVQ